MTFGYGRGHLSGVTSTRGCRSGRACEGSTSTTLSSCTGLHSPEAGRCSSMSTIVPWCDFAQVCCSSRPVLDIASLTSTRSMVESLPELMTQKGQECVKNNGFLAYSSRGPVPSRHAGLTRAPKHLRFGIVGGAPGMARARGEKLVTGRALAAQQPCSRPVRASPRRRLTAPRAPTQSCHGAASHRLAACGDTYWI